MNPSSLRRWASDAVLRCTPWAILRHCAFYEISGQEVTVLASPDRTGRGKHWFQVHESREAQWFALITLTARSRSLPDGLLIVNTQDPPLAGPVMNFCRPRNSDLWLIPNFRFGYEDIPTGLDGITPGFKAWEETRTSLLRLASQYPVAQRRKSAFLNGLVNSNQRLDYLRGAVLHPKQLVASMHIGGVHGRMMLKDHPLLERSAAEAGFLSDGHTPFTEHLTHALSVYADGKTLSDRMRLLLHTGSAVVSYESKYEEFYSGRLRDSQAVSFVESFGEILDLCSLASSVNWLEDMSERAKAFCQQNLTANAIFDATAESITSYLTTSRRSKYSSLLSKTVLVSRSPFEVENYGNKNLPPDLSGTQERAHTLPVNVPKPSKTS